MVYMNSVAGKKDGILGVFFDTMIEHALWAFVFKISCVASADTRYYNAAFSAPRSIVTVCTSPRSNLIQSYSS